MPNIIKIMLEYSLKYVRIFCQDSPAKAPSEIRTTFHKADPIIVKIKKNEKSKFDIPAGIEIKLLTIGINLQKKTEYFPFSKNQLSDFSILSVLKCNK